MNIPRNRLPLFRIAACATIAGVLALGSAALNVAAAGDMRVMGRLTLTPGSGDWGIGVRATSIVHEQGTGEFRTTLRPVVELTARYSSESGRFESLSLNGLSLGAAEGVLYVDEGESAAPLALGAIAGAAVVLFALTDAFSDDLADAIETELEEHLDD